MLFPLANFFEVSVDELMGYDTVRTETEIEQILAEYRNLHMLSKYSECEELLLLAKKQYPNDYHIMNKYMWHFAGGSANNDPELLRKHYNEFMKICDCILNGCKDERIRLDAILGFQFEHQVSCTCSSFLCSLSGTSFSQTKFYYIFFPTLNSTVEFTLGLHSRK